MYTSKFTQRFQELRKESNKTQAAIATDLGLTPQTLSYYANGREPNYDTLIKIANYFNVSTDYLLGISDAKKLENEDISKKLGLTDESISTIEMLKQRRPTLGTNPFDRRSLAEVLNALIPVCYRKRFLHLLKMVTDPERGKGDLPNWDEHDKAFMERNADPDSPEAYNPNVSDYDVFMIYLHNSLDSIVQEMRGEAPNPSPDGEWA